jgi:hypothetical protein
MSETYSLILNSQDTTNIVNNSSLSAYQYNIRWDAILPRKYERYSVTYQLKSANATAVVFAGTQTATVLTVGIMITGQLYVGMQYINGNTTATIASFGTGTGGAGTYNLTGAAANGTNTVLYSTNTTFTNNIICSVNFGYNTTYEQNNSQSTVLGTITPYQYNITPNIYTSNYNCSVLDNGPIQIGYPSNQVITVRFTNLNETVFTLMPHYQLQLYFEPIKE